jgi:hypothetical protein
MSQKIDIASDPRTIARNVSGIFDATFPQLAPAIVAHFNRTYSRTIPFARSIGKEVLEKSTLQRAMLFELSIVVAEEQLSNSATTDWDKCLERSAVRQRKYFDAKVPDILDDADREVADIVAKNLLYGLKDISNNDSQPIIISPKVPGFRWISSGEGDFATEKTIIEVKCSSKRFSTADYRQIVIYWLLKHIESLQCDRESWKNGVLINPRLNLLVTFPFKDLIELIALETSYSSIVDTFCSIVSEGTQFDHRDNEYELSSWPNA